LKKYFITFGSNDFKIQKKHLTNLVKQSGIYDEVISFGPLDLSYDFKTKYSDILKINRGYGCWIWKVDILRQVLEQMQKGDFLTYSSAGSSFNYLGIERLNYYFQLSQSSVSGNLRFKLPFHYEYEWTSKQIFDYLNIGTNSNIARSNQYSANTFIMTKNNISLGIVNDFLKLLEFDRNLITNKYDDYDQVSGFKENRHDQSILSTLSKVYEVDVVLDQEQNFERFDSNQFKYPFLTVRKRKYSLFQKLFFYIKYNKNINKPIYFYKKISFWERIIYWLNKRLKR
jgi:hypothetical protein